MSYKDFTNEELQKSGWSGRMDANESFHTSRALESLEAEVYRTSYPEFHWRDFIPESNRDGRGSTTVSFELIDHVGEADFINPDSEDATFVDVHKSTTAQKVHEIRKAWRYNIHDLEADAMARQNSRFGQPLTAERPMAVREVCERLLDKTMAFGHAGLGIPGFYSQSGIAPQSLQTGGWATASFDDILNDLIAMDLYLAGQNYDTDFTSMGLTLVLDDQSFARAKQVKSAATDKSVLDIFMENAVYTTMVSKWYRGRLAGTGGTIPRAVMYKNDMRVLEGVVPVPFEFLDRSNRGGGRWEQEGRIRTAGVKVRYKNAFAYFEGF